MKFGFSGCGKKFLDPLDPLATEMVMRSAAEYATETDFQLAA